MDNNSSEKTYDQLVRKAEDFSRDGQFLEAFLIQSCIIEGVIKHCVQLHFSSILDKDSELSISVDRWQISKLLELLLVTGIINRDLYNKLDKYIKQRNKVRHQILTYDVPKRDAALKLAYQSGKEMKTFIVDELIRGKLEKDLKAVQEGINNTLKLIAQQEGIAVEELLNKWDVIVRPKTSS